MSTKTVWEKLNEKQMEAGDLAIAAAINPASTDYYYFMADVCGDGTVYYATTLDEHNANVNTYLSDISNGCN